MNQSDTPPIVARPHKRADQVATGDRLLVGYAYPMQITEVVPSAVQGHLIMWGRLRDDLFDGGVRYVSRMFKLDELVEVG